jgi:hypothetical protein
VYLTLALLHVTTEKQQEYFEKIKNSEELTKGFMQRDSQFSSDLSFFLVLREWKP